MINRRQFLRGVGAAVALPWLPSIARATESAPPIYVALATRHGGIWPEWMYPPAAVLSGQQSYAGHTIRHGSLDERMPYVLDHPGLTSSLRSQLNVLRGLDIPWYFAHHQGGHLGNFAANEGIGAESIRMQDFPTVTIDQHMAHHTAFYPDLNGVVRRSVAVGAPELSWGYESPSRQSGNVVAQPAITRSRALFDHLFRPSSQPGAPSTLLVDRVLGSWKRLASRSDMAAEDVRRLNDHVERLYEIERRISVQVQDVPAEPPNIVVGEPSFDPARMASEWDVMLDILVAALASGVTRIATLNVHDTFSSFVGDWHVQVAHRAQLPGNPTAATLADAQRAFFGGVFLPLIQKLDAVSTPSGSLLDRALVVWSQESGTVSHHSWSLPVITAGGAAGNLRTGQFIDYRDRSRDVIFHEDVYVPFGEHPGLLWHQWLGTQLDLVGVPRPSTGHGGFGELFYGNGFDHYEPAEAVAGERLPLL